MNSRLLCITENFTASLCSHVLALFYEKHTVQLTFHCHFVTFIYSCSVVIPCLRLNVLKYVSVFIKKKKKKSCYKGNLNLQSAFFFFSGGQWIWGCSSKMSLIVFVIFVMKAECVFTAPLWFFNKTSERSNRTFTPIIFFSLQKLKY